MLYKHYAKPDGRHRKAVDKTWSVSLRKHGRFFLTGYRAGGPHGLAPGEWTDDTSMSLALADSIALSDGYAVAHGQSMPLLPIRQLLRAAFGIGDDDTDQIAREKIAGRLLLRDESVADTLPILFELMRVPDPARPAPDIPAEQRDRTSPTRRPSWVLDLDDPDRPLLDDELDLGGKYVVGEPVHQRQVVGYAAEQGHRSVRMAVDQAREYDSLCGVEGFPRPVGGVDLAGRADRHDHAVIDRDRAVLDDGQAFIHSDHVVAIDDQVDRFVRITSLRRAAARQHEDEAQRFQESVS